MNINMKNLFSIEGKTALVTGGTHGLGMAIATGLANARVRAPMLRLHEVLPPHYQPDPQGERWRFARDLLTADHDSTEFTLEEGYSGPIELIALGREKGGIANEN